MRERKCIIVANGPVIAARLIERIYGRDEWVMVEEYDVTGEVLGLATPPPAEEEIDGTSTTTDGPGEAEGVGGAELAEGATAAEE